LRFSRPAFAERSFQKIHSSSVSDPILAWSDFTSMVGGADPLPPPGPKISAAPPSSCAFPRGDLIGVDVKLLSKLRQRFDRL